MNNVLLVQYFYYILYLNIVLYIKQYIILIPLQNRASHVPISEPPFSRMQRFFHSLVF